MDDVHDVFPDEPEHWPGDAGDTLDFETACSIAGVVAMSPMRALRSLLAHRRWRR